MRIRNDVVSLAAMIVAGLVVSCAAVVKVSEPAQHCTLQGLGMDRECEKQCGMALAMGNAATPDYEYRKRVCFRDVCGYEEECK